MLLVFFSIVPAPLAALPALAPLLSAPPAALAAGAANPSPTAKTPQKRNDARRAGWKRSGHDWVFPLE